MAPNDEGDEVRRLSDECRECKRRLGRAERCLRLIGLALVAAVTLPFLLGAYSTNDEITVTDGNGRVRILLRADDNGQAYIKVFNADGNMRVFLGEEGTKGRRGAVTITPRLAFYQPDGATTRIRLSAPTRGPGTLLINATDGKQRVVLGEMPDGTPHMLLFTDNAPPKDYGP